MPNKPDSSPWDWHLHPDSFTSRFANHSRVAFYPYPRDSSCEVLVAFVLDHVLVGSAVLSDPVAQPLLAASCDRIGPVFANGGPPGNEVEIWRLRTITDALEFPDIAHFVWDFRHDVLLPRGIDQAQVAPNHVLIPAPDFHACPGGPPHPHAAVDLPPMGHGTVIVGVIDSGWEDSGPAVGLIAEQRYAEWLNEGATGGPEWTRPGGGPTLLPVGHAAHRIMALAGHANFVAGLIAQGCPEARILVDSHNAAFVESEAGDPAIPTEASVARSLWELARPDAGNNFDLINVGFAFPTLPNVPLVVNDPPKVPSSWSLKVVLDALGPRPPYVVAPAGNQACVVPQYPAAFSQSYDNVVGVGSVGSGGERSVFSNHGPWVSCATDGEDVVSTYIDVNHNYETEDEEDDGTRPRGPFHGWASWSGTSFAAPKVTAALARGKAAGKALDQAWTDLEASAPATPAGLDMGVFLGDLAP